MLRTDLLLGDFETVTSVYKWEDGELLRMSGSSTGTVLVYAPEADERGSREREAMDLVRHAGVPECRRTIESGTGATALIFDGAEDARPLALVHDLPEPTLRAGLTSLLCTISFAHSRGIVHRRIDRSVVLADPSGRFWLTGWADSRPASNAPPTTGVLSEVATDLRDLARAFREALLRRPWPDPEGARIHDRNPRTAAGQELIDAGVKVDRDFARVLSRVVTADPRDAYTGATDVLADLGATDATAFDPWESVQPIGMRREIARVLRLLDHTRLPTSETVLHASSVDFVAPDGAGKSRLLSEIARRARSLNVIVLTAEGGARTPWGGVGTLCRQLVQLLGRGSRMCLQHEDALRHLLGEHDDASRRVPHPHELPGTEGRDPLISQCIAALTDLIRIAFRETAGLLLLDDEEHLPTAARQVWRSAGQFVQAINGGGGVLHALLVSTSAHAYPAELGADRVTVEIRPWRQRDLEKFLARAFAAPGGARDASVAIHRITGGRPGDVVGYLRELERRGSLHREGLRWRLGAPLSSLPPLAGGLAEQVRRSLESCGRDASALVECLAVARDVRLTRTALGDLCDVRGPRLASAADAAAAAGLLVADGAAWRVRTEAVAHKVYAAIPADRCRILHREVLTVLLDTAPDAIDPIATHARASADPRAEAWTREAIIRAQAAGEWVLALSHLDDAASILGGPFTDTNAVLLRAELLLSLGRIGEVIEGLRERDTSSYPSLEAALRALLLLTRAYYEARDWHAVLALTILETAACPNTMAEIRFLRAASLRHLGQGSMAARESRLAAAEINCDPTSSVTLTRHEYDYQTALYAFNWPDARTALVRKLRIGFKTSDRRQVIVDLAKLGNAARYLARDSTLSHAILVRGIAASRRARDVGGAARSSLHGALGYTCVSGGARRRGYRHFSKSCFYAVQSGAASLIVASRLRLIACGVATGIVAYHDKRYVQSIASGHDSASTCAILSACVDLGMCLLYYGNQDLLERVHGAVTSLYGDDRRTRVVHGFVTVGRMWLDEPPHGLVPDDAALASARDLVKSLLDGNLGDLWIGSLAYCALRSEYDRDIWLRRVVTRRGVRFARHTGYPGWGAASLALALALWVPIDYDAEIWAALLQIVRQHRGPLPVALEWQRVLMESRELRRLGDWRNSQKSFQAAEDQLGLFLTEEFGQRGALAHARWHRRLSGDGRRESGGVTQLESSRRGNDSRGLDPRRRPRIELPDEWREAASKALQHHRLVIVSPHARELSLLCEEICATTITQVIILDGSAVACSLRIESNTLIVVSTPDLWTPVHLGYVRRMLGDWSGKEFRVVSLLTTALNALRSEGPEQRAFGQAIDGVIVELRPMLSDAPTRRRVADALIGKYNESVEIDPSALTALMQYEWPGGLAEMECVLSSLVTTASLPITMEALEQTGWSGRAEGAESGVSEGERQLMGALRGADSSAIRELAQAIGRPSRTTLRYLNRLVDREWVARTGRGRGTRYHARRTLAATGRLSDRATEPPIRLG